MTTALASPVDLAVAAAPQPYGAQQRTRALVVGAFPLLTVPMAHLSVSSAAAERSSVGLSSRNVASFARSERKKA